MGSLSKQRSKQTNAVRLLNYQNCRETGPSQASAWEGFSGQAALEHPAQHVVALLIVNLVFGVWHGPN